MTSTRDPRLPDADKAVLPRIIRRHAAENPDKVFAEFLDGEQWTNSQLAFSVWRRANGLIDLGVKRGDYVAVWLPTGKAALEAWFAINSSGAQFTPLNPAYKGRILQHALNLAESRVLIAHSELLSELKGLTLPHLKVIISVGSHDNDLSDTDYEIVQWDSCISTDDSCPSVVDQLEVWDEIALIFTSGTTGPSKAVRCSYLHHYTYAENNFPPEVCNEDRFFLYNPIFHAGGTSIVYGALQRDASLGVAPRFSTETFWQDAKKLGVTTSYIFAAMANFLRNKQESPEDKNNPIRYGLLAPMIADSKSFATRFGMDVYTVYGSTEVPAVIRTELNPSDSRASGKLVDPDHFEARIVDEFDGEVPVGSVGQLIVRHARPWSLNSGYKGMPDVTAQAWRNGWFHTGDGFRQDEEGNFIFVDRIKDAIRRRGENISSLEVEEELNDHPSVHESACVAAPSEHGEDEIVAYVVIGEGMSVTFPELVEHLRARLPYFMVPRYFELVSEIPRSPSSKIQKHLLRDRGLTDATWDREAAGVVVGRVRLTQDV
ncbi:AMP-binding protein [Rhodococcus opacus]|uniref:AMP-binding protein n=1 Tax=Rhodococcus opacus TaxID=37919 RepID=UPI000A7BBB94|nr:AMP-binding protein [Rhodococcus opacus]